MTSRGHIGVGAALGAALGTPIISNGQVMLTCLVIAASLAGARAPDAMEIYKWRHGKRYSLIPHRTITHWPIAWLIGGSILIAATPSGFRSVSIAFIISALIHLLLDYATPSGIPFWQPFEKGRSRRIYRTGDIAAELLIVGSCLGTTVPVFGYKLMSLIQQSAL